MKCFIDGKAQPNPGVGCWGYVIKAGDRDLLGYGKSEKDNVTNNQAEYGALLNLVKYIRTMEMPSGAEVHINTDSELLYNQMTISPKTGKPQYETNDKILKKMQDLIKEEMKATLLTYKIAWVPREKNEQADGLTNKAYETLKPGETKKEEIPVTVQETKEEAKEEKRVDNNERKAYYDKVRYEIEGRLTRDPEVRIGQSGKQITKITIAASRGDKEAEFIDCVAFGPLAEHIGAEFKKGTPVRMTSSIMNKVEYDTKSEPPVKKFKIEFIINELVKRFIPRANHGTDSRAQDASTEGGSHEAAIE